MAIVSTFVSAAAKPTSPSCSTTSSRVRASSALAANIGITSTSSGNSAGIVARVGAKVAISPIRPPSAALSPGGDEDQSARYSRANAS